MSARPPRICLLLESYYPVVGGMESQGRTLVSELRRQGAEVIVITRQTSPDLPRRDRIDESLVIRCGPSGRSSRNRWLLMVTCIKALFVHRRAYDVILVSGFRVLGISAVLIGRSCGKKVLLKAECMGEMSGAFFAGGLRQYRLGAASWPMRLFIRIRNAWLRRADRFISMYSEMTGEFIEYGVSAARIECIPNAVDPARYAPVNKEARLPMLEKLGLPRDRRFIVYTGRLVSYKGVLRLLRVWQEIRAQFPDCVLIMVGEGGVDVFNCEAEARAFAAEQGMQDQVVFTGAVRNVDEYLKVAGLFVLPTENDAFPVCILEAMAAALPVLATPVGALKDVIADRVTGRIIEAGSDGALREALQEMLASPDALAQIGATARREVLEKYTPPAVARRYLELVDSLTREGAVPI